MRKAVRVGCYNDVDAKSSDTDGLTYNSDTDAAEAISGVVVLHANGAVVARLSPMRTIALTGATIHDTNAKGHQNGW
jgi:hypothetical protein